MLHIREFLKNRFFFFGTTSALLINGALWAFLFRRLQPNDFDIPLHYNIYFGIDLVGPWWYLYVLPAAGLAVCIVNLVISIILQRRERIVGYLLTSASVLVQVFFFLSGYLALTQV